MRPENCDTCGRHKYLWRISGWVHGLAVPIHLAGGNLSLKMRIAGTPTSTPTTSSGIGLHNEFDWA